MMVYVQLPLPGLEDLTLRADSPHAEADDHLPQTPNDPLHQDNDDGTYVQLELFS